MFLYLYRNRTKEPFFSKLWIKSWVKRLFNFPELLVILIKNWLLILGGAKIGDVSIVECTISRRNAHKLHVGNHSYLAKDVGLALHESILIGSHVVINSGVRIYTASHNINDVLWPLIKKKIVISDYAWVASDAIILPGVTIGYGAVIGAGAVVRMSIPDRAIVIGNPCQIIGYRKDIPFAYSPTAFTSAIECWLGTGK